MNTSAESFFSTQADSPASFTSETDNELAHFFEITGVKKFKHDDKYFVGMRCKNWEEASLASEKKIRELQSRGYTLKKLCMWYRDVYGTIHVVKDVEY